MLVNLLAISPTVKKINWSSIIYCIVARRHLASVHSPAITRPSWYSLVYVSDTRQSSAASRFRA